MNTLKKVAMASLVGATLFASASFAAPAAMQPAADAEALVIAKAVNNNVAISCSQAALRIGNKAKAKAGATKGAELHSAIQNSVSTAAIKAKIAQNCITPVVASKAASTLTGLSSSGKVMGLAKAGSGAAAGGLLGGAVAATGLSTAALVGGGLLVGGAVLSAGFSDSEEESMSATAK